MQRNLRITTSILLKTFVMLFTAMVASVGANASTELVLHNHGKVRGVISNREQNRVYVKDDRIENVFGSEEMFVYQSDAKLGQIFIRPKTKSQGFTVTITTEKNKTIDMYLAPDDRDSETLILVVDEARSKAKPVKKSWAGNINHIIESAVKGEPISGYKEEQVKDSSIDLDHKGLVKEKIYKNNKQVVTVYTYKNLKPEEVVLKESMFLLSNNVTAVALEKKKLARNETIKIVIIENENKAK